MSETRIWDPPQSPGQAPGSHTDGQGQAVAHGRKNGNEEFRSVTHYRQNDRPNEPLAAEGSTGGRELHQRGRGPTLKGQASEGCCIHSGGGGGTGRSLYNTNREMTGPSVGCWAQGRCGGRKGKGATRSAI